MASDHRDRDTVLRARLVALARKEPPTRVEPVYRRPRQSYVGVVTVVVLVVVVALSAVALRLGGVRGAPAVGGSSAAAPIKSSSEAPPPPLETLPAGKLLGRFTSKDGPNQDHTIRGYGLAIATQFVCTGTGSYAVFTAHATGESGNGGCGGGGVGAGSVAVNGTTKVRIRTDPDMRWTYTLVGIPAPTRAPLVPVPGPIATDGSLVPYCTSAALTARYVPTPSSTNPGATNVGELVFTNTTTQPCALAGYPEVRFLSHGKPLGHNTMNQIDLRRRTDGGLKAVILAPGKAAYSQVDWYAAGDFDKSEGTCVRRAVTSVQVNLHYDLAAPEQTGTLNLPIGNATACLNGAHGALGKYGQIASTVFVDYSRQPN